MNIHSLQNCLIVLRKKKTLTLSCKTAKTLLIKSSLSIRNLFQNYQLLHSQHQHYNKKLVVSWVSLSATQCELLNNFMSQVKSLTCVPTPSTCRNLLSCQQKKKSRTYTVLNTLRIVSLQQRAKALKKLTKLSVQHTSTNKLLKVQPTNASSTNSSGNVLSLLKWQKLRLKRQMLASKYLTLTKNLQQAAKLFYSTAS